VVDSFGSALYPFGASESKKPCFKLVGIQRSEAASNAFPLLFARQDMKMDNFQGRLPLPLKNFNSSQG
jgi:hypothetical protein